MEAVRLRNQLETSKKTEHVVHDYLTYWKVWESLPLLKHLITNSRFWNARFVRVISNNRDWELSLMLVWQVTNGVKGNRAVIVHHFCLWWNSCQRSADKILLLFYIFIDRCLKVVRPSTNIISLICLISLCLINSTECQFHPELTKIYP